MKKLLWAVYKMVVRGNPNGMNVVCEQSEWDAMELAQPGQHQLIQRDIANEGEAEKLARGTSGDPVKRRSREETVAQLSNKPMPAELRKADDSEARRPS
jgi:hypothetical protein